MKKYAVLLAAFLFTGCGAMNLQEFSDKTPQLDIFDYFLGETNAWGLFEDRFGKVRRQFRVDIQGRHDGDTLVLEEDFIYDDGERARRVWTIRRDGTTGYLGTAADIVGEAQGRSAGNALNWRYRMDLPVGENTLRVSFDDWMFLQEDGVLINRAKVKKLGLEVGSVTLFFVKEDQGL